MKCAARANLRIRRSILCSCMGAACVASGHTLAGEQGGRREAVDQQRMERIIPAGASLPPMRRFDNDSPGARRTGYGDERASGLTPDERRQLRRDIRDAARELYRDAPEP
jgi:hypothetical protein